MSAPVPIGRFTPGSDEWNEARSRRIGGSEIAAVLGLSKWESPTSLWLRKMGYADQQSTRPEMEWGNRLEPAVAAKYIEGQPGEWHLNPGSFVHPERSWQMASPDAVLYVHGHPDEMLEVKTALYDDDWGTSGTDEIPVGYRCQVLWNLDVWGLATAHIPVLIGGHDYREYTITTLDAAAKADTQILRDAGLKFITSMVNNERPDIDGHDQTLQVIREQHPDIEPVDVEISDELRDAYLTAVLAEKDVKRLKQRSAAEILDHLGKARNAVDSNGDRFAYRKPNGEHAPYLCPDPKAVNAVPQTIQGAIQ